VHLTKLDFAVLLAYVVGLFWLGLATSSRQTSAEMYFLSGRRTPWFLAGVSVLATLLSTLTFLSIPGEMIRYGLGFFSMLWAFVLIIPAVNHLIIPALMRMPVTSVYDYLEHRFSPETRTVGAAVFVVMRLVWIGMIMYTASMAVAEMTGWRISYLVLVMGIVTTFYTTAGGMQAVIWSDFAQFVLLFGGALYIPIHVALRTGTGPLGWWDVFSQAGRASVPVFSLDPTVRITMVGMILQTFLWNLCTHGADQVAAQRYLSTPSSAAARRSVWVFSILNVGVIVLLMVCGLSLFHFYYSMSRLPLPHFAREVGARADALLPEFMVTQLPSGLPGLMLAALLAAAMSSLSSGINSISTVAVTDFVQRFGASKPGAEYLPLARTLAALAGLLGIGLALLVDGLVRFTKWNLVELIERVNHLFVAPLGALFLAGIVLRHVGTAAALLGFSAGILASVLVSFSREIFGMERGISFMWIMPVSFAISLVTSCACGYLFPPPAPSQLAAMYRGSSAEPATRQRES
jgi:SSS family solute:Na+ symporter